MEHQFKFKPVERCIESMFEGVKFSVWKPEGGANQEDSTLYIFPVGNVSLAARVRAATRYFAAAGCCVVVRDTIA